MDAINFRRLQLQKLRRADLSKINFGCGNMPLPDWTNVDGGDGRIWEAPDRPDIIAMDVFDFLAHIDDAGTQYIASEQFFEHFDRHLGHALAREWFRILKPNGVCRIVMPDLEKEVRIYLGIEPCADWDTVVLPHRYRHIAGSADPYGKLIDGEKYTKAMLLNNGMHMDGHRYLYDFEAIEQTLRLAGFRRICRCEYGQSEHAELAGIDKHDGGESGHSWIPKIVLAVEATK
jgi:predicted SAM-dependent methyltransferase